MMLFFVLGETMISGDWLISALKAIIIALGSAGAAWIVAIKRNRSTRQKVTLQEPLPEMPVRKVYTPPTFSQHQDAVRRIAALENDVRELRREQAEQFRKLLEVGEERKDKIMEKVDAVAVGFHQRVNQIVEMYKTPPPRR